MVRMRMLSRLIKKRDNYRIVKSVFNPTTNRRLAMAMII